MPGGYSRIVLDPGWGQERYGQEHLAGDRPELYGGGQCRVYAIEIK